MIIKQFALKNFGKHEELAFQCDGHVIGLLGPNGSGKSTVLDAIEFAITGETRDPIPSYVRHGEGNASVSMTFIKNGMEGYIYRQFGKTPKRKLVWDGKTTTAAKAVDRAMADIFGADKQTIANAVFINQGMLDNILFSSEATRRQLFIKLVNMAFCEQRAHVIEGKIKKLQSTIVDLGPSIDAAGNQVRVTHEAVQTAKQTYEAMPDYAPAWSFCDQFIRTEEHLKQVLAQIGHLELELHTSKTRLAEILAVWDVDTCEKAEVVMQDLEKDLRQHETDLSNWRSVKAELVHYHRVTSEINEKTTRLRQVILEIQQLNPESLSVESAEAAVNETIRLFEQAQRRERMKNELADATAMLHSVETKMRELQPPQEPHERNLNRGELIATMRAHLNSLSAFLAKQTEFAQCEAMKSPKPDGSVQCVQCGLLIANPEALQPEALEQMRQNAESVRQSIEREEALYRQLKVDWDNYHNVRQTLNGQKIRWTEIKARLEEDLAKVPEVNVPKVSETYERMRRIRDRLPVLEKEKSMLSTDIGSRMAARQNYKLASANLSRESEYTDTKEKELLHAIKMETIVVNQKRVSFSEMTRVKTTVQTLEGQMRQRLATKQQHEQILERPMPTEVSELSAALGGDLIATRAELQARRDVRAAARGRLEQAQAHLEAAQFAYQDLVRRVEADAEKRKLIDDLTVLRDVMRPDGLPLAVVNYHFEQLARLTQDALNQLDANFSIQVDHEVPLSFRFVRLDEPEHTPLSMNKLSGGQRVRLCTAFLIAVQQRLVKEVGLLVLDEPSTHVDQAGVESLAELLNTLSAQLGNTETQIIVSDHHPMLRTCFNKVLELA